MTSPTPSRQHLDGSGHSSSGVSEPRSIGVGPREQLVALRRNLPTHSELLRVCEQFPEDGERLSNYVSEVEHKIREMESVRREQALSADRHRRSVAKETAAELERRKVREAEERYYERQIKAEENQRKQKREHERQLHEKRLLEQSAAEHMERFRRQKQQENEEESHHRVEHWTEAIVQAQEQRGKIQSSMKQRMEAEHREWQRRVAQSRARKDEAIEERVAEVAERNARLSNMAQHKHDLAMQARLRRETGKEERTQMVRAAVRRKEAANMAAILNRIEENELRHDQIVAEQKKRRVMRVHALRRDREMHRQLAQQRQEKIKEEQDEKRQDFEDRTRRDFARHLQHHQDVRAEIERRIHETNERRHRAHHVVHENRKAELDEHARKIISRTAKVGTAVGMVPHSSNHPGEHSVLDEEVQRSMRGDNSFRLDWDRTSRQRLHLDSSNSASREGEQRRGREPDPRSQPAILRTQHLSPKLAPGGKSLEFILDLKPRGQQGPNLRLIAEAGKQEKSPSPSRDAAAAAAAEKKKKEEEEEKKKREEAAAAKKKKQDEEEAAAVAARKKKKEEEEEEAVAQKKKQQEQQEEEEERSRQRHQVPQAEGANSTEADAAAAVSAANKKATAARLRSLFIGVSFKQASANADQDEAAVSNLACISSASMISTAMATMQNVLGQENLRNRVVLVDDPSFSMGKTGQPTFKEITSALDQIVSETKPGEAVAIVYAGADSASSSAADAASTTTPPSIVPCSSVSERVVAPEMLREFLSCLPEGSRCTILSSTPSGASLVDCGHEWKQDSNSYRFVPQAKSINSGDLPAIKAEVISISAAPVSESVTLADALAAALSASSSSSSSPKYSELFTRCRDTLINAKESAVFNAETTYTGDGEFSFLAPVAADEKYMQK